jgi:endonuclease YncB( thermonuclease family)
MFILFAASMVLNVFLPALTRDAGPNPHQRVSGRVTDVIDGRTIKVEVDGVEHTVAYIGVEPPLSGERFYEASIAANEAWLNGREVELEADEQDKDPQGRLLRYVWLDNAMVNLDIVGVGLARAADSGPNDRYADLFQQLEDSARAQGLGIWSEDVEQPVITLLRMAAAVAGDRLPI